MKPRIFHRAGRWIVECSTCGIRWSYPQDSFAQAVSLLRNMYALGWIDR